LLRWWLFFKGISQFLSGRAEDAEIAADSHKRRAPFQITTRIGFDRREDTAGFAVRAGTVKNVLNCFLYIRV